MLEIGEREPLLLAHLMEGHLAAGLSLQFAVSEPAVVERMRARWPAVTTTLWQEAQNAL